ncbi:putative hemolysin [Bosea sp. OAE752]|uniref:L-ornithine N(alpha)-acyltransferase n=2 Tax=Bosea TaxID=85413 RepID=A0A927EE56_9HYPH|nr:GNAT family N-acetyltransferase [Bosea spartocytisi]MBD3847621.1 GNAT family N-acetyltransferase [Bosea spartocytisi]MCT4472161.1 GNAT family N-acetyltransferase [Bosea spartocytisi]
MALHVSERSNALPARFSAGNPLLSRLAPMMLITGGAMRRYGLEAGESAPLSGSLGRLGSLEVRLARGPREIWRAQRLRYRVFYQEMSAKPDVVARMFRRDADRFDKACDHLLVIDHAAKGRFGGIKPKVVGTYRLMRQSAANRLGGFYTQSEFDLAPLLARHPGQRFLELGRSCVLQPYRNKRTVELLWSGIWAYLEHHRIDAMFGCASFDGTDPDALALPLSFLHHHARSQGEWSAEAHPEHLVGMDRLPAEMVDYKLALKQMPPLIKGYLRLGARFGSGAVIDRQFGTTDVLVVLPVSAIDRRYAQYYGGENSRYAA